MPMLDVFRGDAFSVVSLTAAILKAPYKPGRIGSLGLFRSNGITTTTAVVEEKDGLLSLIESSPRGGPASQLVDSRRRAIPFTVPHFERDSTIMADSVQNVRAFGSEDATVAVQTIVNQRLETLRQMHEVTLEYLRVGAIKGQVLDGDGTTVLLDLFTAFNVAQQTYPIDTTEATLSLRSQLVAVQRLIEAELGAEVVTSYRAFCGDAFFDELLQIASVTTSLQYQESKLLRTDLRSGFEFGGIVFENYRGRVGGVDFIPTDEAYVVPEGTSIFTTSFAPADFMETVNTVGLPVYAKIATDQELNRWARVHSQSNPLALNLRPRAVVKLTLTT